MVVIHELEGTTTLVRLEQKELHKKYGEKILQSKGGKMLGKANRCKRRKKVELVCLVQSNKGMSLETKKAKGEKGKKKKREKVENKDAYDRGNGIPHLPTVDMSYISQNSIIIFSLILFLLMQSFSTCYLSFPSESKESILTQVRNNSLHKLAYGHSRCI